MRGSVFKRCGCPIARGQRGERLACKKTHGSWSYVADASPDPKTGRRRQLKKGGFATKADAEAALAELANQTAKGSTAHDAGQTVEVFLRTWLADKTRNGLRDSTQRSYGHHIDDYLVPSLGHLRLRDLRPVHVQQMLNQLTGPNENGHHRKPATVRRIHATLRSAMSTAKRRRLIAFNPAVDIDLPNGSRPKVRPWEPSELGTFLDAVADDPLASLFEVIAATGLRRGEALGLRWQDVNFETSRLVVRQQVLELHGWQTPCALCGGLHGSAVFGRPKTISGEDRSVDLDSRVLRNLAEHREQQRAQRIDWADAYVDHDLVFARPGGDPHRPEWVSTRFHALVNDAGLRQIRLHDLRHGRASLLLAAGVDIALVSKVMGHSTIALTSDTYSHLLEGVGREAAERASALVPRRSKSTSDAPL